MDGDAVESVRGRHPGGRAALCGQSPVGLDVRLVPGAMKEDLVCRAWELLRAELRRIELVGAVDDAEIVEEKDVRDVVILELVAHERKAVAERDVCGSAENVEGDN